MSSGRAKLACRACRRLKRKCSREIPACSLCERLNKACHYQAPGQPPRDDDAFDGSSGGFPSFQLATAVIRTPQEFPSSFFLDPAFFQSLSPTAFVCSAWPCESQLRSSLGSDIDAICQHYFSTIHKWLPVLSKKRLLHLLHNPAAQDEESQSLLLVCMKLSSNFDHDDGTVRNPAVYQLAKECCTSMERDRFISLRLVQCLTLIAVYELGHAIFPEAYATIGHASRLGGMIGLHNKTLAQQLFVTADTWTCGEEQRRTWWAIFLLDEYVNIGTRYLPPSVLEPCLDALLPVNDQDWNEGRISASESLLTTSFHSTANLGSFARTCQAAHILNKVLKHRDHRTHSGQDTETVLHEALALHGALVALEESLAPHCVFLGDSHNDESAGTVDSPLTHPGPEVVVTATSPGMENALALSLSASARMVLYKIYGPNEPKAGYGGGRTALETQMQRLSLAGTRDLVLRLGSGLAGGVTCGGATSPMLSSLSYHVAKQCAWLIKEDYDTTMYQALRKLVDSLRQLATEWQVAQEYLALLGKGGILGMIPDE